MGVGEHEHGKRAQYEAVPQRGICDIVGLHTCSRAVAVARGRRGVEEQDVAAA